MSPKDKGGYILLHRSIFENPIFKKQKFSYRDAWIWLIATARFKDGKEDIENQIINAKRGNVYTNNNILAERWNWGKGKISRFITKLETERMIEVKAERRYTIITICNYEQYQDTIKNNGTRDLEITERGTERGTERSRNEEPKKTERHIDERMFLGMNDGRESAGTHSPVIPILSKMEVMRLIERKKSGEHLTKNEQAGLNEYDESIRKKLEVLSKDNNNIEDKDKLRYSKLSGLYYNHRDIKEADIKWMKEHENRTNMESSKRISHLIKT